MGIFDEIFGGGQGEAGADITRGTQQGIDARKQFLAQALGLLGPFREAGVGAVGQLQGALSQEADPTAFINKILGQFQESPAAKFQEQRGISAAQNAAEAGGTLGSGAEQKALEQFASGVAGKDQNQFLQNVLGVNTQRLQGLQGLGQMGLSAAGQGASLTGQAGAGIQQGFGELGQGKAFGDIGRANALNQFISMLIGSFKGGALAKEGEFGKSIKPGLGAFLGATGGF